jgi:hypothetical protein
MHIILNGGVLKFVVSAVITSHRVGSVNSAAIISVLTVHKRPKKQSFVRMVIPLDGTTKKKSVA